MSGEPEMQRRGWHNRIWRWHFYAGLFTAPFLIILAVTGAIYLFNDEILDAVYPELRFSVSQEAAYPPEALLNAATSAFPGGHAERMYMPTRPGRTAEVFLTPHHGDQRRVFVDPATAKVLGSYIYTHTIVGWADVMHGSLLMDAFGGVLVEAAACWAIVLMATGLYLWWPKLPLKLQGTFFPRWASKGRFFWRDIHAITGVFASLLILFLLITGLPWTDTWSVYVLKPAMNALDAGYPKGYRAFEVASAVPLKQALGQTPWTLGSAPLPQSEMPAHAGHHGPGAPDNAESQTVSIGVNAVTQILAGRGMPSAYRLTLPAGPRGVYTANTYPDRPEGQRTIHIDRYSGNVLVDMGFQDYGLAAKMVELGVAIHMGNYFGRLNQAIMLIPCIAILIMVVAGFVLWWRRRPENALGAPVKSAGRLPAGAVAVICLAGLFLPLLGASMVLVAAVDRAVSASLPALARWLGTGSKVPA